MPPHRGSDRPRPERFAGLHHVDSGTAELAENRSDPGGWSIRLNGLASSYVHVDDPTRLDFEYMQWTGHVLDVVAPPRSPLSVVHLGGAGCTLALYVAATRPGSPQTVFEIDAVLVRLMRQAFGLRAVRGLRLKTMDGLEGLRSLPDAYSTVVIRDAFDGAEVPRHLTDVAFYREAARVLTDGGVYIGNVADTAQVREARIDAATALEVFANVAMIAEPGQLRGRRYGNVLLVASQAPLPDDGLVRKLAGGAVRARYVEPSRVRELVAGVKPRLSPS
ncbi:spermidine synthase [Jiangella endophytica]|uniref:spermidine synthase n=1 Tax=Jiangella endophytica TaxID=1623398 RepID=UPI000E342A21|nr:fused MFS/spermidine synthase [Jiangella endophytica]